MGLTAAAACWGAASATAQTIVYADATADGTVGDGLEGPFDGTADVWDYNWPDPEHPSQIAGTISWTTGIVEYRTFWEYNLPTIPYEPPVSATLTFTLLGHTGWPFPDSEVLVYAYPGDGWEYKTDYNMGPAVLQGSVMVYPNQEPTLYTVDVSDAINDAIADRATRVAFRFQINTDLPAPVGEAFIEAYDGEPSTKPYLTITDLVLLGDADGDNDVDMDDYAAFASCLGGPLDSVEPECEALDLDDSGTVDLHDFLAFQMVFTGPGS